MTNFYNDLDFIFENVMEKYINEDELILNLVGLKTKIISLYENVNKDRSYELYIANSIKKKYFNINEDGSINSYYS